MTTIIRCGDIGEIKRYIELEPLEEPAPVPELVPAEPEAVPALCGWKYSRWPSPAPGSPRRWRRS